MGSWGLLRQRIAKCTLGTRPSINGGKLANHRGYANSSCSLRDCYKREGLGREEKGKMEGETRCGEEGGNISTTAAKSWAICEGQKKEKKKELG